MIFSYIFKITVNGKTIYEKDIYTQNDKKNNNSIHTPKSDITNKADLILEE